MKILTWNIQATKGCDGFFDVSRIVKQIKKYGDLDVICLQELAKHIHDLNSDDQPSLIEQQFPGFESCWAPGFSVVTNSAQRCEFGNITLVKQDLFKNARVHILPSPQVAELQIPRTMVEVVVEVDGFQFAVFNAHLAFHSSIERMAQIQALTRLRDQIMDKAGQAKVMAASGPYNYTDTSQAVVLCGDMNVGSETDEFKVHITEQNWIDCWDVQQSMDEHDRPTRQPTCGCFDAEQWSEGPHVRDYFLATENIAIKAVRVEVDVETDASDHQPVLLELGF